MSECKRIDAYLCGDLSEHEATRFNAHLASCDACSTVVDQQQWIDKLLRDPATAEAVPAEVVARIDLAIVRTKRRRRLAGGFAALTAAASLLIALAILPSPPATRDSQLATHNPPPTTPPVATFVGTDDMIVVHHESPYPNVTIVEVYPTITARRRWRSEPPVNSLPSTNSIRGDQS